MQPILKTTEVSGSGFGLTHIYFGHQEPSGTLFGLPHHSLGTNNIKVEVAPFVTSIGDSRSFQSRSPGNVNFEDNVRKTTVQQFNYAPPISSVSLSSRSSYSNARSVPLPKSTKFNGAATAQATNKKKLF